MKCLLIYTLGKTIKRAQTSNVQVSEIFYLFFSEQLSEFEAAFFYIYIFIIFSVSCFVDSVDFKKGKSVLLLNYLKMIIQQQNQSMLLLLLFKGHTIKEANVETSALGTTEGRKL